MTTLSSDVSASQVKQCNYHTAVYELYKIIFSAKLSCKFILQEYFVPRKRFSRWIDQVKPLYKSLGSNPLISLLNTTIRFVNHDNDTKLPYAHSPDGVYAFVLYYRIRRNVLPSLVSLDLFISLFTLFYPLLVFFYFSISLRILLLIVIVTLV